MKRQLRQLVEAVVGIALISCLAAICVGVLFGPVLESAHAGTDGGSVLGPDETTGNYLSGSGLAAGDVTVPAANCFYISGNERICSTTAGNVTFQNSTGTVGTVIKSESTTLAVILKSDGTAGAQVSANTFGVTNTTGSKNRPVWVFSASDGGMYLDPTDRIRWSASANAGTGTNDTGIERLAAGVIGMNNGTAGTVTGAFLQNGGGRSVRTSDATNATTTLATTGLSVTLLSGRKYTFDLNLIFNDSLAADGAKFDFNGGSATSTFIEAICTMITAGATAFETVVEVTALNTSIADATLANTNQGILSCHGHFVPSGNGTFIPQYAQNAHTTGTLTLKRGSYFWVEDMP